MQDSSPQMQTITLRVISGADRGKVFRELTTPITLGREEGNSVQLNDERISRYHAKIQEDDGRLVATDLDSTNGTRINGHVCSLKILRFGDTISIGRTVLLVGTRDQMDELLIRDDLTSSDDGSGDSADPMHDSTGLNQPPQLDNSSTDIAVPRGLSPGQAAELTELLDHIHQGIHDTTEAGKVDEKENTVQVSYKAWQNILQTQSILAELIRAIEDPSSSDSSSDTGLD